MTLKMMHRVSKILTTCLSVMKITGIYHVHYTVPQVDCSRFQLTLSGWSTESCSWSVDLFQIRNRNISQAASSDVN